jgi:HEAT repeat protein
VAELNRGWPEGRKLHHLRLCIAGLAKGANETSCEHLRPLIASKDPRIGKFVAETIGSYKSDERFFPPLLLDALESEREEVVQAAIRWTVGCRHTSRASEVQRALVGIFERGDEALKFQVSLPLIQEFDEADAWLHLIRETQSKAPLRSAAALSSLADAKHTGREASRELIDKLTGLLDSPTLSLRWGATKALGTHDGPAVIDLLIPLLADSEQSVRDEAARCLVKQADKSLVAEQLRAAVSKSDSEDFRRRSADVLKKLDEKPATLGNTR